jgi:hypothetical protein
VLLVTAAISSLSRISATNRNISMPVIKQKSEFTRKAVGTVTFTCRQGKKINKTLQKAIGTREGIDNRNTIRNQEEKMKQER